MGESNTTVFSVANLSHGKPIEILPEERPLVAKQKYCPRCNTSYPLNDKYFHYFKRKVPRRPGEDGGEFYGMCKRCDDRARVLRRFSARLNKSKD